MNIRKQIQEENIIYNQENSLLFPTSLIEAIKMIPENSDKVLDVGCGNGGGNILCTKLNKNVNEYYGIDFNSSGFAYAKSNVDFFVEADIENMEDKIFPENFFDVIMFNDVLEHLVYPEKTLKKLIKHLKPSGVVISSIPNVIHQSVILNLILNANWTDKGVAVKEHLKFFTLNEIISLFENSGLYLQDKIIGVSTEVHPAIRSILKSAKPWMNINYEKALIETQIYQYVTKVSMNINNKIQPEIILIPNQLHPF